VKWFVDLDEKLRVVAALAEALDLLQLPRYAAICRSGTTREILNAYEVSTARGKAAFRRAAAASGITPPDLPEFEWGAVMGLQEASARSSTADYPGHVEEVLKRARRTTGGMITGMTKKIGISLREELYDWAAREVEEGRAESVSALIAEGLELLASRAQLEAVVKDLRTEVGDLDEQAKTSLDAALGAADEAYRKREAGDAGRAGHAA
jgi:Arc/MetJ-type ribon-helix-helix transcriptional regulator